jgi:hypothetical protein
MPLDQPITYIDDYAPSATKAAPNPALGLALHQTGARQPCLTQVLLNPI